MRLGQAQRSTRSRHLVRQNVKKSIIITRNRREAAAGSS
jgi:hypothetical protein